MRAVLSSMALAAALSVGMSGCTFTPRFAPGKELGALDSQALCRGLNSSRKEISSFRALLDATVIGPDESPVSFRYAMVGTEEDTLRIDVLPQQGAYTLAMIVVRGSEAMFLDTQAKTAAYGCSVDEVLEKFLGVEGLTSSSVQALVTGHIPQLTCEQVKAYRAAGETLFLMDTSERIAWEVNEDTGAPVAAHFVTRDASSITAIVRRRSQEGSVILDVRLYRPVAASASMVVRKLILNPAVSDQLFSIAIPSDYSREQC